jgi:hypothetical protein
MALRCGRRLLSRPTGVELLEYDTACRFVSGSPVQCSETCMSVAGFKSFGHDIFADIGGTVCNSFQ